MDTQNLNQESHTDSTVDLASRVLTRKAARRLNVQDVDFEGDISVKHLLSSVNIYDLPA